MAVETQITWRNIDQSDAIETAIREKSEKLGHYYDRIQNCRVMVEAPHTHKHKGKLYHVRLDITVPGNEIVVTRDPAEHGAHEDIYVVIRDAFDAARRQLQDYAHKQQDDARKPRGD